MSHSILGKQRPNLFGCVVTRPCEGPWELAFGLCSARLQAGMCLIPKCPPEGGRYKNVPILGSHAHSAGLISLTASELHEPQVRTHHNATSGPLPNQWAENFELE